jgi:hypothetical protein
MHPAVMMMPMVAAGGCGQAREDNAAARPIIISSIERFLRLLVWMSSRGLRELFDSVTKLIAGIERTFAGKARSNGGAR